MLFLMILDADQTEDDLRTELELVCSNFNKKRVCDQKYIQVFTIEVLEWVLEINCNTFHCLHDIVMVLPAV